ncbi:MAG TPA: hypothetical protein VG711_09725 [Phycisphaerales bacterium]|nr:hypothetical protein [Phycisphaerales bacterium]
MDSSSLKPWRPTVFNRFAGLLALCCWLFLACWLIGRLATDRWYWSQFLFWIPTPFAIAGALFGFTLAFRSARDSSIRFRRRSVWLLVVVALFADFLLLENHMFRSANPTPSGLKLVHWNMSQSVNPVPGDILNSRLLELDPDITIMTSPGGWGWDPHLEPLNAGQRPVFIFPIVMLSKLPILQGRQLIADNGVFVGIVQLDATQTLGRPITIYVVDFLSRPTASRMAVADEVHDTLSRMNVPPPDLVVGDMNITRHSASLAHMFPDTADAYDQAGHGYAATFERRFPLFHIDHVLLAPWLHATRYDVVDFSAARHRAQVCWFDTITSDKK